MMTVDASPLGGVGPYQLPAIQQPQLQLDHHQHQQSFPHLQEHRGSLDDLAYAFSQVQTYQPMPVSLSPPPLSSSASPSLLPTTMIAPPLDGAPSSSASATASTLVFDQIAHVAQALASSSPTPSLIGTPSDAAAVQQQQQQQPRARAAAAAQGLSLTTTNLAHQPVTHETATLPSAIMSAASPMSAHAMLVSPSSLQQHDVGVPCPGSGSDSDGGSSSTSNGKRGSKKLSNASSTGSAAAAASEAAAAGADGEKQRSRLTRDQMSALKRVYAVTYFPDKQTKEQLSRELNIPVRTIQIWFQNQRQYHRIKMKKKATQQAQSQSQVQVHQQTTLAAAHQQAAAVAQQQAMIAAMSGAVPPPSANPGLVVNTNASITTVAPACGPGASTTFSSSPFMAAPSAPSPGADSGIGSATPTTPFGSAASPFPGQPGPQTTRRNSAPPHFFGQVPTSLPPMPVGQMDQPMVYQPQMQHQQQQQHQRRGSVMVMPTAMPTLHEHQTMYPTDQTMLAPAPQYCEYNAQQQQQQQQQQQPFPSATSSSQQFDMLFNNAQAMVAPAAEPLGCSMSSPVHHYNQQQQAQVFSPAEHTWQQQQQQQQYSNQQQPMIQRSRSYSNTFF